MTDTVAGIRACGYRVIVEPENEEKTTEGGIIIPSKERAEQEIGRVVAVGPDAWYDYKEPWAKVGDRCLYSKYGGKIVDSPENGIRYRVLNDEDIVCIINFEGSVSQEDYHGDTSKWKDIEVA